MSEDVPQSFIDFVNRCKDGHPVIASMDRDRVPHTYETTYMWPEGPFTVTECAFAEATHEDFLACPWPEKGSTAHPDEGWVFYWVSYD